MEGASVNHGDNITTNQGVDHLNLPPGYRFHPTNEEIITHCLVPKVMNSDFTAIAIGEVNLNRCEPWELPSKLFSFFIYIIFFLCFDIICFCLFYGIRIFELHVYEIFLIDEYD